MDFTGDKIYKCGDSLSKIYKCGEVVWSADTGPDYSKMPLTFEILPIDSSGTIYQQFIQWRASDDTVSGTEIYYSLNGGPWNPITSSTDAEATQIQVVEGDKISFMGFNNRYATGIDHYNSFTFFGANWAHFKAYGNIMSLIDGRNYAELKDFLSDDWYVFVRLFNFCGIESAENLVLPATALTMNCYREMFRDCPLLVTGPDLPATTLDSHCYYGMFRGCASLTTAPELPASILANSCYRLMFYNCTSLQTAPDLLAPTLPSSCYYYMFYGCSNLNYVKCLAIEHTGAKSYWLDGVSPTGTFVKKAGVEWQTGSSGIPEGWTVIEE